MLLKIRERGPKVLWGQEDLKETCKLNYTDFSDNESVQSVAFFFF